LTKARKAPRPAQHLADGYQVIGRLSLGRDLEVYDAWSDHRACRCVIKRCRPDRVTANLKRRLVEEGNLLKSFTHRHLVRCYDVMLGDEPLVVLETVSGMTLESVFENFAWSGRRMTLPNAAIMLTHIASATSYLHRHELLHLDLKPSNIIVEAGQAKVIDLSLAHASGVGPAGWGTRSHMSPEQTCGELFTTACDVWALGLIAYEALSGINPFFHPGRSIDSKGVTRPYLQHLGSAPPVETHRRLPRTVADVVNAALSAKPMNRPSLNEFATVFYDANPDPTLAGISR
jgi:eukaryotic-like serine/threonine-protein kinase